MKKPSRHRPRPSIEVRNSSIHGYGVFALRKIRTGTRVIEYLGERVSHKIADARHENKDPNDNHTFLFTVDRRTVIDASVGGNEARYINHGCDPNCESATINGRVFITAIKTIQPGEELAYDYSIQRDADDEPGIDDVFGCRCGAEKCRGTMLEPRAAPRAKRALTPSGKTRTRPTNDAARRKRTRRR
jgi:SET domain-containing protein